MLAFSRMLGRAISVSNAYWSCCASLSAGPGSLVMMYTFFIELLGARASWWNAAHKPSDRSSTALPSAALPMSVSNLPPAHPTMPPVVQ